MERILARAACRYRMWVAAITLTTVSAMVFTTIAASDSTTDLATTRSAMDTAARIGTTGVWEFGAIGIRMDITASSGIAFGPRTTATIRGGAPITIGAAIRTHIGGTRRRGAASIAGFPATAGPIRTTTATVPAATSF